MATYIMLMKFTTPGIEAIKDAQAGRAAGKKAAKALGIKWKQQYLVMGEYDIITVVEAPDDETVARFALMGGMSGGITTHTMRAFTEAEADVVIEGIQPPPPPA